MSLSVVFVLAPGFNDEVGFYSETIGEADGESNQADLFTVQAFKKCLGHIACCNCQSSLPLYIVLPKSCKVDISSLICRTS